MGTRNLICAIIDNQLKLAQYGQWDGYPTGQGQVVVEFILSIKDDIDKYNKFIINLKNCMFLSDENIMKTYEEFGVSKDQQFIGMDISKRHKSKYPELSRDTGSGIFDIILYQSVQLRNSIDFAADSLFCEWCYVIDFDNKILEIYKGFNKNELSKEERFYNLSECENNQGYKQVKLYKKISFDNLIIDTMYSIEKELSKEEEEE